MMIRKVLMVIGTAALFSACDHSNSNGAAPVTDQNGGLGVTSTLTQSDLILLARADFQERLAFPEFANRSDNQMPDLSDNFEGIGDLSNAFAGVGSSCTSGVMNYATSSYDASWNCPRLQGTAHINASNVTVNVSLQGVSSSASIKRIYTTGTDPKAESAFVIDRLADDVLEIASDSYKVDGESRIGFANLNMNRKIDVIVNGQIYVSKNSSAAQTITITSDKFGYYMSSTNQSEPAKFCDGSLTYSTSSGLKTTIALDPCPSSLQ